MPGLTPGKASAPAGVLRRTLVLQLVLIAVMALALAGFGSMAQVQALAYGGAITLVASGLQMWQASRIDRVAGLDIGQNMRFLYRSWLERIVLTASLLAVGIVLLKLHMPALIAGFVTGQAAVVIEGLSTGKLKHHG